MIFHILVAAYRFAIGGAFSEWVYVLFCVDEERNVPTLYSAIVILICALMTRKISRSTDYVPANLAFYWKALSVMMFFLFVDEAFCVHELWNGRRFKNLWPEGNGFFKFAWVIPYVILVAAVGSFFIRFLLRLPRATRVQFIIAGCMYVFGALGMELVGSKYVTAFGFDFGYYLLVVIEESLEMLAMIVFLKAVLNYYLDIRNAPSVTTSLILQKDPDHKS
jgi:hypothetical protein